MDKNEEIVDKLIKDLDTKGEITIKDGSRELFVQAVDDKEGYSFVSSTNKEFKDSREAAEWVIENYKKI